MDRARAFEFDGTTGVGVVLLHGFTGAPQEVEPVGRSLADIGVGSIGPMLPGHGTTEMDLQACKAHQWTEAALETLDRAASRWDEVIVGGLSMGGALSLQVAAREGARIRGVFSLATPARLVGWRVWALPIAAPLLRTVSKKPGGISDPALMRDRVGYDRIPLFSVRELVSLLVEVRREIPRIDLPTLLVHSKKDRTIPIESLTEIQSLLTTSSVETVILERSDHVVTQDVEWPIAEKAILGFVRACVPELLGAP